MKLDPAPWTRDGYTLRLARAEDAEAYFRAGFDPLDPEVARLTGCKSSFTYDEVVPFFLSHMGGIISLQRSFHGGRKHMEHRLPDART